MRHWPIVAALGLTLASENAHAGIVACAGVLGFCAALILILMLAMPALLAPPGAVHRAAGPLVTPPLLHI